VIEVMLAKARARITRYAPEEIDGDVLLVDLRSNDERARDGIIPGSVHVPRSVLEWRCDQESDNANPVLAGKRLVLVCAHGESSSLAAASLVELGLEDAGDLAGGFEAWQEAGRPVVSAPESEGTPGMGGQQ
jgi:rhodanese-related sulfurtransferase